MVFFLVSGGNRSVDSRIVGFFLSSRSSPDDFGDLLLLLLLLPLRLAQRRNGSDA